MQASLNQGISTFIVFVHSENKDCCYQFLYEVRWYENTEEMQAYCSVYMRDQSRTASIDAVNSKQSTDL